MLKKILKWAGIILLLLIITLSITVALRQNLKFDAAYPAIKANKDSAALARGKYLVFGPGHCADCHSPAGTDSLVNAGMEVALSGGRTFALPVGAVHVPNITSDAQTGIGNLKDEEIARSLRNGVGYDGRAIIDFMPFHNTSDEDLTAIISYIRTLPPVHNEVPKHEFNMLGKFVKAFFIKPTGPDGAVEKTVTPDSSVAYGKYMANSVANCRGCHTDRDLKTGAFIGEPFAGGFEMESQVNAKYIFHTPNISPDKKTGHIKDWNETTFISRFRKGKLIKQSPMPWGPFSRMSDMELKAIYRYLQTVTPIEKINKPIMEVKS